MYGFFGWYVLCEKETYIKSERGRERINDDLSSDISLL